MCRSICSCSLHSWVYHLLSIIFVLNNHSLKEQTEYILSKFTWGHAFLELNANLLEDYSKTTNSDEMKVLQDQIIAKYFSAKAEATTDEDESGEEDEDDQASPEEEIAQEDEEEEEEDDAAIVMEYIKRKYEEESARTVQSTPED